MFLAHIEPKKFYKRLLRKTRNAYRGSLISALFFTAIMIVVPLICAGTISISQLNSITSVTKTGKTPIIIGVVFAVFTLFAWKGFVSKRTVLKITKREIKSFNKEFPYGFNALIKAHLINAYLNKCRAYWWGFFFVGLSFIATIYSFIACAISLISGVVNSGKSDLFTNKPWSEVVSLSFPASTFDKVFFVSLFIFIIFVNLWAISQYSKMSIIKNIWRVVGYDDEEMLYVYNGELKDKWLRTNKRGKIIVMVILCVIGLAIYIFMKKLIVAIFKKSFNHL